MGTDWEGLLSAYLQSPGGLRRLAQEAGVGYGALQKRATAEGWAQLKRARQVLVAQEPQPATAQPEPGAADAGVTDANAPDRRTRLQVISDQLTAQLMRATGELDKQTLKHRRKTRETSYDDGAHGKPVLVTEEEREQLEVVSAPVDNAGLQRLSVALKNLCDVVTREGEGNGQSLQKVAALMERLDAEANLQKEGAEHGLSDGETTRVPP